jgi:hypothetical protein
LSDLGTCLVAGETKCKNVRMTDPMYAFDTDGDGKADVVAYDTDGDGRTDKIMLDHNKDGEFDVAMYDDDGDGQIDRTVSAAE